MKTSILPFTFVSLLLIIPGCSPETRHEPGSPEHIGRVTQGITDERLVAADNNSADWITYGLNYREDRFSSLDQINKSTVNRLGLAWSINLGSSRGIESTPLVVDGIMYLTGPWSVVYAIDLRKGKIIWTFDPGVPKWYGEKACCDVVNRGVALFQGKVYIGSLDGRLIAINATTGQKEWETMTVDQRKAYTITGAPRIINGKVLIGNGGAEYGVRGYVTAYDAQTGDELWRFYTVPGNPADGFESPAMEAAAKTWTGEWWKFGGGGTAWDAIAYDPDLNLVYIGVGNGAPWNRDIRSPEGGDNLYLSSIVALNPDNGEFAWHYQTTPGDTWDYTATQQIILADLEIEGRLRKVLMQAPKNGFFYVLDRTNGQFISAKPYVYVNWASEIDPTNGRPIETEFSRYPNSNAIIAPSAAGGHNWQAMAYNPSNGLVYIPAREMGMLFGQPESFTFTDDGRSWNVGSAYNPGNETREDSLAPRGYGKLIAWDPLVQKEVWSVTHTSPWNAGVLATNDLVFQGNAEGEFAAYEALTGEKVWSVSLGSGIIAPPVTYEMDGIQYLSIAVGWGGVLGLWSRFTDTTHPGTLYTFVLDGKASLPDYPAAPTRKIIRMEVDDSPGQVQYGESLYIRYCSGCHGGGSKPSGGGIIPALQYSVPETFEIFHDIVGKGLFLEKGMPDFGDRLNTEDITAIKHYILYNARQLSAEE